MTIAIIILSILCLFFLAEWVRYKVVLYALITHMVERGYTHPTKDEMSRHVEFVIERMASDILNGKV